MERARRFAGGSGRQSPWTRWPHDLRPRAQRARCARWTPRPARLARVKSALLLDREMAFYCSVARPDLARDGVRHAHCCQRNRCSLHRVPHCCFTCACTRVAPRFQQRAQHFAVTARWRRCTAEGCAMRPGELLWLGAVVRSGGRTGAEILCDCQILLIKAKFASFKESMFPHQLDKRFRFNRSLISACLN